MNISLSVAFDRPQLRSWDQKPREAEGLDAPASPDAELRIAADQAFRGHIHVASRAKRNRSALYQRKPVDGNARTRERSEALAALNIPISDHYESLKGILPNDLRYRDPATFEKKRLKPQDISPEDYLAPEDYLVIAFPIGDLTANLLRPHFDAVIHGKDDQHLFFLEDEPIEDVAYTLLVCFGDSDRDRFAIYHDARIAEDGQFRINGKQVDLSGELRWWAACPPLLQNGHFDERRYGHRDSDLGHLFGFVTASGGSKVTGSDEARRLNERLNLVYASFPRKSRRDVGLVAKMYPDVVQQATWASWCQAVDIALEDKSLQRPQDYHAGLGQSASGEMILLHHYGTVESVALALAKAGAEEAVLLDSGGSCAIWGNWLNGNRGGVLANHWNFRPGRGAVSFLVMNGYRGITRAKADAE